MYKQNLMAMRNVADIQRELIAVLNEIRKEPESVSLLIKKHLLEKEMDEALSAPVDYLAA